MKLRLSVSEGISGGEQPMERTRPEHGPPSAHGPGARSGVGRRNCVSTSPSLSSRCLCGCYPWKLPGLPPQAGAESLARLALVCVSDTPVCRRSVQGCSVSREDSCSHILITPHTKLGSNHPREHQQILTASLACLPPTQNEVIDFKGSGGLNRERQPRQQESIC